MSIVWKRLMTVRALELKIQLFQSDMFEQEIFNAAACVCFQVKKQTH